MKKFAIFKPKVEAATQPNPAPGEVTYNKAMKKCRKLMDKKPAQFNVIVVIGSNPPLDTTKAAKFVAKWVAKSTGNSVYAVTPEGTDEAGTDTAPYAAIAGGAQNVYPTISFFDIAGPLNDARAMCLPLSV